jgi:hypothetical protein
MRTRIAMLSGLLAAASLLPAAEKGWVKMFDGKTLNGWKTNENAGSWTVEDGTLAGHGDKSHLFWMKEECENCEFKATIKLAHGSNSGMYFRTKFMEGFPNGYEAQVNNTHKDWKKTGSLYNFVNIKEQLIQDDTWWTQHIIVEGNHVIIKVNDKTVVDYVDEKNTYTKGYLALQQHDPGSKVWYKDLMMRKPAAKK